MVPPILAPRANKVHFILISEDFWSVNVKREEKLGGGFFLDRIPSLQLPL